MKYLFLLLPFFAQAQISINTWTVSDSTANWSKYNTSGMVLYDAIDTSVFVIRQLDTIPVILLVCDTVRPFWVSSYIEITSDTIRTNPFYRGVLKSDTISQDYYSAVWWVHGYEVVEKHNTSEGQIDPGGSTCIDSRTGKVISCWHDYWKHVKYLDADKKELKYLVWMSKPR